MCAKNSTIFMIWLPQKLGLRLFFYFLEYILVSPISSFELDAHCWHPSTYQHYCFFIYKFYSVHFVIIHQVNYITGLNHLAKAEVYKEIKPKILLMGEANLKKGKKAKK